MKTIFNKLCLFRYVGENNVYVTLDNVKYYLNSFHKEWSDAVNWNGYNVYLSFYLKEDIKEIVIYKIDVVPIDSSHKLLMKTYLFENPDMFKERSEHKAEIISKVKLNFGKFKGLSVDQIDRNYLKWLCSQDWFVKEKQKIYLECVKYLA